MEFKIFDIAKTIALLTAVAFIWFHGQKLVDSLSAPTPQPPQVVQIDENAIKLAAIQASNQMADKLRAEFEKERSSILEAFKEQRKKTQETLDELGKVKGELKQTRDLINTASDHSYTSEKNPENTQDFKKIYAKDADGDEFPIAWSIYYPFRDPEKQWKTGTYPLEFSVDVLETQNPDGTFNRYAELHVENNQMKETRGKRFKLRVTDINWQKYEQKEKSFFWWNPRLALAGSFTNEDIAPILNLSLSSYGKTKGDMDWRFFTFGAGGIEDGTNWKAIFSLEPFSWNFGKAVPLIDNIFVGPVFTIDTESEYGYGVQVSVPF